MTMAFCESINKLRNSATVDRLFVDFSVLFHSADFQGFWGTDDLDLSFRSLSMANKRQRGEINNSNNSNV